MRMASDHGESLEKILGVQVEDALILPGSFLKDSDLRIPLKYFRSMGGSRNLTGEILSGGMPVHVKTRRPERTLGDIIDLPFKSNVNRLSVFSIKR